MIDFDATVLAAANAAFGESVAYTTALGQRRVTAIFNEKGSVTTIGADGMDVITNAVTLHIRASVLGNDPRDGDLVNIRGIQWKVTAPQYDGVGEWRIVLHHTDDTQADRRPLPPVAP